MIQLEVMFLFFSVFFFFSSSDTLSVKQQHVYFSFPDDEKKAFGQHQL